MYDLATIHRLNDAAALAEQFPWHNCAEEVTENPVYEGFMDPYIDREDAREILAERDALALALKDRLSYMEQDNAPLADRLDLAALIRDNTKGRL